MGWSFKTGFTVQQTNPPVTNNSINPLTMWNIIETGYKLTSMVKLHGKNTFSYKIEQVGIFALASEFVGRVAEYVIT